MEEVQICEDVHISDLRLVRPKNRFFGTPFCHLTGLVQHVSQPSRGANFLDLILSNGQNIVTSVRDGVLPSDHKKSSVN